MAFVDQLDQTVERIIDEAINFYMDSRGFYRVGDGNFHYVHDPTWEVTPPGKPARTAGGQVTQSGSPAEWGFDYGSGTNSGSLVYGHFEETIRAVFDRWRSIPTPKDFDQYLDYFREAAWYLALPTKGDKVTDVGNAALVGPVDFLGKKIGGDDMGGDMILAFDQNFCTPLPTVIQGQYAVTLLAGMTLCGEKEIWVLAEQDILAIADKMHAAMKDRGSAAKLDLSTIIALVNIAGVFPTPAKPILAGAGTVLSGVNSLLNPGNQPTKPVVEFKADTPDGVIEKTKGALKTLAETIKGREDDIKGKLKDAMNTVTSRAGSFDMPKPKLLDETQINGMKVDLEDLSFIATKTLPEIEKQLNLASDYVSYGNNCSDAWYRPIEIGVSDTVSGPWDTWSALASLAEDLTADLAWEVKESGAHLAIAADQTGRTEAEVESSMQRHTEKLGGGSGYDPIGDAGKWMKEHP